MKKIAIYASKDLREAIFERLRDLGIVHVVSQSVVPDQGPGHTEAFSETLEKLRYLDERAVLYNPIKKTLIDGFTGKKPPVAHDDFLAFLTRFDVDKEYAQAVRREEEQKSLGDEISLLGGRIAALEPWNTLDIPLSSTDGFRRCKGTLAVFQADGLSSIGEADPSSLVHTETLWESRGEVGVWLVVLPGDAAFDIGTYVSRAGGRIVSLDEGYPTGLTVTQIVDQLSARLLQATLERSSLEELDRAMSQDIVEIGALADHYLDQMNLATLGSAVRKTQYTLVVDGWVKEKDLSRLQEGLREFHELHLATADPGPDDDVPVHLENHPLIEPFEVITNIYGFPKYNEIDPTPFLAPFFWLFFGICLGDAIYGIVLFFGARWFIKSQGLKPPGDKLLRLLQYSGIATVLAGALTASWMADLAEVFLPGSAIARAVAGLAVISPVDDPLTMLVVSFGFGLIHVWVGLGVKLLSQAKTGEFLDGIFTSGAWMVLLPSLVVWAVSPAGSAMRAIWQWIMVFGAVLVMYGASRGQKNILLKPFTGAYGLYSVVGYFSDIMSYSRLLALGLASAIIGVVVNKVALLVSDMIPYVGWLAVPVILAVGHVFNLVINVLGSFVHSGRLQFIEFFTKFFEGGGKPFSPLKRVSKHVLLE